MLLPESILTEHTPPLGLSQGYRCEYTECPVTARRHSNLQEDFAVDDAQSTLQRITEMVVRLELAPGSIVSESTLATQLGVPRSEVRESIQQLRESGLVSVLPRAGIAISSVALTEIRNVFEARLGIEGFAARLASQRAVASDVKRLQALADQLARLADSISKSTAPESTLARLIDLDRRLHIEIVDISRNPHLQAALNRTMLFNSRIWNLFYARNGGIGTYYVSHQALIDALAQNDADAAAAAVAAHLESSAQELRRAFEFGQD